MEKFIAILIVFAIIVLGMQSLAHVNVIDTITTIVAQIGR